MKSDGKYSRHVLLKEIGLDGQAKIQNAKILIVGLGGIGSPIALHLALAGAGSLGLVDHDYVEETNLMRQIIYSYDDIDDKKALAAAKKIKRDNPNCEVKAFTQKFSQNKNAVLIDEYDFIVDATDDMQTKFLLNKLCLQKNKILFSGAFLGWKGYYSVYKAGVDSSLPCFACFHGDELNMLQEKACFNQGVVAPAVVSLGAMLATEILKEICDAGDSLAGKVMLLDFLQNKHRLSSLKKRKSCKHCNSF